MIYLDNAATTLRKPRQVVDAVVAAMTEMGNASRGAGAASLAASRAVHACRVKLAELLGCPRPDHVCFAANATEALNAALSGLVPVGGHVVSTDLEHNSVLRPLYHLEARRGVRLDFAPADRRGLVRLEDLERLVGDDVDVVVCTHASNLTGNMIDVARVAAIAHARGALLVVDAAQTAGSHRIDMGAMGIDVVCFTGHKGLMGPMGTGGACVRDGVEIEPLKMGGTGVRSFSREQPGEYPTRLEAGTLNCHGIAGLSAALDFIAKTGVDEIGAHEERLTRRFRRGLRAIEGVRVYGDFSATEHAAIVALNVDGLDSARVADLLSEEYGIATRPGAHCAPRMHEALGTSQRGAVRFSFSWFTTDAEVDSAIDAVRDICAGG